MWMKSSFKVLPLSPSLEEFYRRSKMVSRCRAMTLFVERQIEVGDYYEGSKMCCAIWTNWRSFTIDF